RGSHMLQTTLAGSLPKPSWLAEPERLWAPWKLSGPELEQGKIDATILALKMQEDAGLDIVSDGEQARVHFVHGFLANLDGIEFDEPAFNVYMREVADWGIAALEAARKGLKCTTAVHICYGYGIKANVDWKETLGSEWRQYEETFPLIAKSSIDQVSLECRNSHVPIELIRLLEGKDVLVGAIDVANTAIETPEEVAETIRAALRYVAPEKLFPCTNCGMAPMKREVAYGKLAALSRGAHLVREEMRRR